MKTRMLLVLAMVLLTLLAVNSGAEALSGMCSGDDCGCNLLYNECAAECQPADITCFGACKQAAVACSRACCTG